ncbi:MAG: biotin--[acetyl-CoA-carboxylase] ligase [Proteobacteria bacterium]|nr:biotin--[acetyl-CoA-carboxylase] ligase [Pseudomonadota bacterium]
MYAKILNILRADSSPKKSHDLGRILGISPEDLIKYVNTLEEYGYIFQSTPGTIKLTRSPDTPFSWEFPERESRIHYFQEIDSTMTHARKLGEAGAPDFTVVIAETQEKGRGRLERKWVSSSGGLYFTLVLRPVMLPERSSMINFLASLVLAKVLNRLYPVDARVKWPNDILINERKVSGMIAEMVLSGPQVNYINLGIGINVNNHPEYQEPNACSLKTILGKPVSRCQLLGNFLDEFEKRMKEQLVDHDIISEWKQHTITIGRQVRVVTTKDACTGIATDVDDSGALILEQPDGKIKRVIYGDCFLN